MHEKILIVDDHAETLNLVSVILKRQGYEIHTANSGFSGLEAAEREFPNLILLDVMMPEMDGYEVCRRIRKHESLSEVPIILFTAKSRPDEKWEGFQAGATDYLVKPTNTEELSKRVRMILDRSQKADGADGADNEGSDDHTELATQQNPTPAAEFIGVVGVRGGTGTTTTAINLAFTLAQNDLPTRLVDLDMQQGHIGLYLNRQTNQSLNAFAHKSQGFMRREMTNQLVPVNENLDLLLALPNLDGRRQPLSVDQMNDLLYTLSLSDRRIVLDLGQGITATNEPFLAKVDQLIVCIRPERVAVSAARQLLTALDDIVFPGCPIHVVILDFGQGVQLPRQAVENFIGHKIDAAVSIPHRVMAQAVNSGKPIVMAQPNSKTTEAFHELGQLMQAVHE